MLDKQCYKRAIVHSVDRLNLHCKNTIASLASEASFNENKKLVFKDPCPLPEGKFHTAKGLMTALERSGWVFGDYFKGGQRYGKWDNGQVAVRLWFNSKGIYVDTYEGEHVRACKKFYFLPKECVFESIWRLSVALNNCQDISPYLHSDGFHKRDMNRLPVDHPLHKPKPDNWRADFINSNGGSTYMIDGIHI